MILDRIFGVSAAIGFALAGSLHIALATGGLPEPDFFNPAFVLCTVCAAISIVYLLAHPSRVDNIYSNEIEFFDAIFALPSWAMAVTAILAAYAAVVALGSYFDVGGDLTPPLFKLYATFASVTATVAVICFVIAAYCLVGIKPPPAFASDD